MENMVRDNLFGSIYKGKTCLVTGDTGFKGSWLVYWLTTMGAKVVGFSLEPNTTPNHFELLDKSYNTTFGDVLDFNTLFKTFEKHKPEIVFHLAAQSLVRYSYDNPIETFNTNVIGTLNVFEASRKCSSVKAIVNITSDKCYDNKEWIWGYRENDPMGGFDPYSASKGCSELVTSSYQKSFFNNGEKLLASARSGNVIGGGDWAEDRLIPDIVKAAGINTHVNIRNPLATRPWQHVLEPLSGYLMLGWKLLEGDASFAESWNFGPELKNNVPVKNIINTASSFWNSVRYKISENNNDHHEANLLMLDCSKANKILKWHPVWDLNITICKTINWYKDFYENKQINTEQDLNDFIQTASEKSMIWTL